jgi:predicted amidophosphoribosyltransferase
MDEKARDLSVQNSFNVLRPKLIAGQRILVVDDVFTTGATVSYCAKALKKAGAIEVNVLTIARAV